MGHCGRGGAERCHLAGEFAWQWAREANRSQSIPCEVQGTIRCCCEGLLLLKAGEGGPFLNCDPEQLHLFVLILFFFRVRSACPPGVPLASELVQDRNERDLVCGGVDFSSDNSGIWAGRGSNDWLPNLTHIRITSGDFLKIRDSWTVPPTYRISGTGPRTAYFSKAPSALLHPPGIWRS